MSSVERGRSHWTSRLFAMALLAAGLFGIVLPDMGYFTYVPGDIGDPRFNSVVLEHLYRLAIGTQQSLWDPDFFFPFKGVLTFSDSHLGSGAVYVLARLCGLMREHAFDAWYLVGYLATFGAALHALRRFGVSLAAAAIGAFLFTFAMPVLAQNGHAQLVYRFAVPLAALALWETFEHKRLVDLARVAFWTAWQFYCSIYIGIFLGYLLAAMLAILLIAGRPITPRPWLERLEQEPMRRRLAAAGVTVLSGAGLAYLLGTYYLVARTYGFGRTAEEITPMLPRWASYFISDVSPWWSGLTRSISLPVRGEHQMFVGVAALALALVGAVAARMRRSGLDRLGTTMLLALLVLVAGTLWIRYFSFYYLIAWLPGINSVRAVARVIVVMLLPLAVLASIGADVLARRLGGRHRVVSAVAFGLLGLAIMAEPLNVTEPRSDPISLWKERQAALYALLPAVLPDDAILWVRTGSSDVVDWLRADLDGMILGQDIGRPTLNGYSGNEPPGAVSSNSCTTIAERLRGYADFKGGIDVSDYARRVVTLDLSPCVPGP